MQRFLQRSHRKWRHTTVQGIYILPKDHLRQRPHEFELTQSKTYEIVLHSLSLFFCIVVSKKIPVVFRSVAKISFLLFAINHIFKSGYLVVLKTLYLKTLYFLFVWVKCSRKLLRYLKFRYRNLARKETKKEIQNLGRYFVRSVHSDCPTMCLI